MHGHIPPPNQSRSIYFICTLYVRGQWHHYGAWDVGARWAAGTQGEGQCRRDYLAHAVPCRTKLQRRIPSARQSRLQRKVRRQQAEGWDLLKVHPGLTRAEYDAMANTANEDRHSLWRTRARTT